MSPRHQRPPLPGGPYLIVGLARSGQAVAEVLAARGERVIGCDSGSPEGAGRLAHLGVELHLDGASEFNSDELGCVVKSPGVPRSAPPVVAALQAGAELIGELELAWRLIPNSFVAVTGTNGKTTVTELLGHIWREAERPVAVAGNVGTPLSAMVGELGEEATVVCECSSFQLEDASAFAPDCALLLNLAPDHIDRHGSLEAYREAKLRIFARQIPGDWAIFDSSDPGLADVRPAGRGRVLDLASASLPRLDPGAALAGPHNVQNARAAAAAALAMGIDRGAIERAVASFGGLPHRLERIGERSGVEFVNDSKATNVAAALAGIRSFERGVRLIAGGSLKGESFEELAAPVAERCAGVYLTGPAAGPLAEALAPAASAGVELRELGSFGEAFAAAVDAAEPGETVLLSPACASFDEFPNYEARGERFRELVGTL